MVKREAKIRPRWLPKAFFLSSLSSILWFPSPVWSQITQIPLTLDRQPNEEFNAFVQRATVLSTETLKQRFESNQDLNQLRVVVMGVNHGEIAPLLAVTMSREQWRRFRDASPYIRYFPDSQALLNFQVPSLPSTNSSSPSATATPAPTSAPAPGLTQPTFPPTAPEGSTPFPVNPNTNP